MSSLSRFAKAIYSAIVAGLGALGAVLVGNTSFTGITAGQWVFIALTTLVAGGGVYGIPNTTGGRGASGTG